MKCATPTVMHGVPYPCGKCTPCLFNRKRIWAHRIILESQQYSDNTFMTLTYNDASLPILHTAPTSAQPSNSNATLCPEHLRDFLKRLRKKHSPNFLRFFACGEYGETHHRPHYHLAVFNFPNCTRGQTGLGLLNPTWDRCCATCHLVGETWGKGNIYLGTLETDSAQYVAGYVTKKMTHRQDPRLNGREPEFARMSNRPGIAAGFMWDAASAHLQFNLEHRLADVPVSLAHGKRQLPLGRYLRKKYRTYIGKDEKTPPEVLAQIAEEVRDVRETAFNNSESFQEALANSRKQSLLNLESKISLQRKKS